MLCWTGGMAANLAALPFLPEGVQSTASLLLFTLYAVPMIFVVASPEEERWAVRLVDGALALALGLWFFAFVLMHSMMPGSEEQGVAKMRILFDVQNVFIALFALMRFQASSKQSQRDFYGSLTLFALAYLVTAALINHLHSDETYGKFVDAIISIPFLIMAWLAYCRPAIRGRNPSQALVRIVNAGSPLMLPVTLLVVSALLVGTWPVLGIAGFAVAMIGYGARNILVQVRSVEERERLEGLSFTDALTGLGNRRQFDETLRREWDRARRSGTGLALMMIDIDHFKMLNDRLGHPAGDASLREVAGALRSLTRRAAEVATRYGGEEFAVILPDADPQRALAQAKEMAAAVQALGLVSPAPLGVVTVSIGVAHVAAPFGDDVAALTAAADAALYEAKQAGRNRVVLHA